MKKRQFIVIVPEAGDRATYVGPFERLAPAVLWVAANLEGVKGVQYVSVIDPSRYARIVRERYVMDHPPQSVIDIDTDLRAESIRRWRERKEQRGGKELRCKQCQSVLSPEPTLEEWGFCSSECERDYREIHP